MATVNKNFRIKHGLVVEGTTGTINSENILTEGSGDQYILDLVGGANLIDSVASGLDITNTVLSIDRNVTDDWYDESGAASAAQTAAQGYADGLAVNYDAAGSASAAQTAAQSYADGLASNYDAAGAASTAESNANTYTDTQLNDYTPTASLDTTIDGYGYLKSADLTGYATETYVDNAVSDLVGAAPALLDTLNELAAAIGDDANYATTVSGLIADKQNNLTAGTNIDITADTISVTGLDTADVAEDASRLYFTNQRAIDAGDGVFDGFGAASTAETNANAYADGLTDDMLDGTTPFTDININDVAKQVAARTTSLGSVPVVAYQFNKSSFKSGKFLVKIDNGTHNEISEILVTLDASGNVAITEYAIVGTNGTRGTITANTDATHCRIVVDPVNDSTITVTGTVFNA